MAVFDSSTFDASVFETDGGATRSATSVLTYAGGNAYRRFRHHAIWWCLWCLSTLKEM